MHTTVGGRESEFGGVFTGRSGLSDDPVVIVKSFIDCELNVEVGGGMEGVGLLVICFGFVRTWVGCLVSMALHRMRIRNHIPTTNVSLGNSS